MLVSSFFNVYIQYNHIGELSYICLFYMKRRQGNMFFFTFYRKESRYTEKDAAIIVRQMLKVAAECHLHGLVHRDMKPEVKEIYNSRSFLFKFELFLAEITYLPIVITKDLLLCP